MSLRTRQQFQVAGNRMQFRPDLVGQYTVVATIVSSGYGTTNVTQTITAGTYLGVNTCALCHSGGVVAPDKFTTWTNTPPTRASSAMASMAARARPALPASSATPSATTKYQRRSTAGLTMSAAQLVGPGHGAGPDQLGVHAGHGAQSGRTWPISSAKTATGRAASTPTALGDTNFHQQEHQVRAIATNATMRRPITSTAPSGMSRATL